MFFLPQIHCQCYTFPYSIFKRCYIWHNPQCMCSLEYSMYMYACPIQPQMTDTKVESFFMHEDKNLKLHPWYQNDSNLYPTHSQVFS